MRKNKVLYSEKSVTALAKFLAPKYRYANWKWASIGIPDEKDIVECFRHLVARVQALYILDAEGCLSTGGLYAERKKDGKIWIGPEKALSNRFFPEEWEEWRRNLERPERKYRKYRMIRLQGCN